jgi:hypothetical protein
MGGFSLLIGDGDLARSGIAVLRRRIETGRPAPSGKMKQWTR